MVTPPRAEWRALPRLDRRAFLALSALGPLAGLVASRPNAAAQTAAPTPDASASPEVDDTIWFFLAPEGKSNGGFFELEMEPGDSQVLRVEIGNGSTIPVRAIIYAADVYSGVNGGFAMENAEAERSEPTTWLDFETETRDFEPGQGITKAFTVTVPEDAEPGQYITGLAIETAEGRSFGEGSPLLHKVRLATAVFIIVPGPVVAGFEISDIQVAMDLTTTSVSGLITNTGNVRVRPKGSLRMTGASGAVVIDVPIAMGSVYARDSARFEVGFPVTSIPEGTYTVDVELSDADTEETASLTSVRVEVAASPILPPLMISAAMVTPQPSVDNVVFAQVEVTITNTGMAVSDAALTLRVYRDGELEDEHELASSLSPAIGETVVSQPYIPETGTWKPGTYTFEVVLSTGNAATGEVAPVSTMAIDQEIVVP